MVETGQAASISNVFVMSHPQHMPAKLSWELEYLTSCMSVWEDNNGYPEPIYRAFNTAVTAWHISDWLWQSDAATRAILKKRFKVSAKETTAGWKKGLKRFQNALAKESRALAICREIANGSKHMRTSKPDPKIKALTKWSPVVEGVGLAKPGDLIMSLMVADGEKEQDAVLWFIDAFGYWTKLFEAENLAAAEAPLPQKIVARK